jgi:hypothetical protein
MEMVDPCHLGIKVKHNRKALEMMVVVERAIHPSFCCKNQHFLLLTVVFHGFDALKTTEKVETHQ